MEIAIQDLSKSYGKHVALHSLSLNLPSKGIIGLLGPNGAGKTTLMQILATLQPPTSGQVQIGPYQIGRDNAAIRAKIGYLPQHFGLYPELTGEQMLDFIADVKGYRDRSERQQAVHDMLRQVNLYEQRNKVIRTYSGGMKQRLGIAQALIGSPPLIILDEPTVGLDPEERLRFRNELAELCAKCTILLSTHIVGDIEDSCSFIVVMQKGKVLYAGSTESIIARYQGKVWTGTLPQKEWRERLAFGQVIRKKISSPLIELRVISEEIPFEGAKPVTVQLEDVYMALTGGSHS